MNLKQLISRHQKNLIGECKYQVGVDCDACSVCEKCGWNPEVDERRKEKIRESLRREEK